MPGAHQDQQSLRVRVRKVPSLTVFKGDDVDPEDVHPFHFEGRSRHSCRQGYDHLDILLQRRDISGRTKELLRVIQSKYKEGSCTTVQGSDRASLTREINALEDFWESHWEKLYGLHSDRARFEELSQELKELKFFAIFGDYAAIFCKEIKNLGPAHAINKFKQWRDAEENLKREDQSLKEYDADPSKDFPDTPLHDSIDDVSSQLTPFAPPEMIRFWIRTYATRNETFHCGVHEALEANNWPKLGSYILTHRKILPSMVPFARDGDNILVSRTIHRLQKKLFESLNENPRPTLSGQPPLRLTPYGKELERKQQLRRGGSVAITADDTEP